MACTCWPGLAVLLHQKPDFILEQAQFWGEIGREKEGGETQCVLLVWSDGFSSES
jgi:hypothetical protein